ncbi:MAG: hypothetical protein AAF598_11850 [Bacteroidota bacterium]
MNYSDAHYARHLIAAKVRAYQANYKLIKSQLNRPVQTGNTTTAEEPQIDRSDLEVQLFRQKEALTKLAFLNLALDKVSNTSRIIPYLIYDRFTTITFEELYTQIIPLFHSQKVKSIKMEELRNDLLVGIEA